MTQSITGAVLKHHLAANEQRRHRSVFKGLIKRAGLHL